VDEISELDVALGTWMAFGGKYLRQVGKQIEEFCRFFFKNLVIRMYTNTGKPSNTIPIIHFSANLYQKLTIK
jgi:hypothetical protein